MPDTVDQTQAFDFKSAILGMHGDEEMMVARLTKSFISDPNCGVLVQDTQLQKSDGLLTQNEENLVVSYKGELYWKVAGPDLAHVSDEQIVSLLKNPSTNPFSAFFYVGTRRVSKTLTYGDLERIVIELVGVAVDALDFESLLLWWRDDLRQFPTVGTI
jgi:hypothetical protein